MSTPLPIPQTILALLEQDPYAVYHQDDLVRKVTKYLGIKNSSAVVQALRTMVMTAMVKGEFIASGKVRNIKFQDGVSQPVKVDSSLVEEVALLQERIAQLTDELSSAKASPVQSGVLEVQLLRGEKTVKTMTDTFHACFPKILRLAKARKNIFIYGPTGCGKSHVCSQLAKALDLPFYFIPCTVGMSESQLTGKLLPLGKAGTFQYVIGEFVKAYESGGVFLLDEIDAADPNVLLVVNAALANGKMAVPNRPENPYAVRHPDFICVAAANTVGTGADRLYSGRNKLDAATLDRFAVGKVFMGYDPKVEESLCPDFVLRNRLQGYRERINTAKLERWVSSRFMRDAYEMIHPEVWGGDPKDAFTFKDVDEAFFQGWRKDEILKVQYV